MATAPAGWIRIVTVDVDAAVAFLSRTAVLAYAGDQAVHFRGQGGNGVIGRCGGLVSVTGGWFGGGGGWPPRGGPRAPEPFLVWRGGGPAVLGRHISTPHPPPFPPTFVASTSST